MGFKTLSETKIRQILELHESGIEKKEIAKRLAINYSSVCRYINGVRKDRPNQFYSIDTSVAVEAAVKTIYSAPVLGRPSWFEENLNLRARR